MAGLANAFGSGAMTNSVSCMEKSDCYFVIGSNTTENHPLIATRIIKRVQEGAKLIVADNRNIKMSGFSNLHIRHKNGTDVALMNGMMHVIIKEGLEDKEFIASRTENYEELKKIVSEYSPERAAEICGIKPEEIVEAARMFAKAGTAMVVYCMGITQHTHGVDNVKSTANLAMLTGNLGKPGTGVNPLRGQNNVQGACDMGGLPNVYTAYQKVTEPEIKAKFEKAWGVTGLSDKVGLTVTTAIDAAADGKLRALYIMGENPMLSDPDQKHVQKALENLELIIVQDIFPTKTTEFAHVILPAASFAEKDGTFSSTERRVQRIRKAINPVGESKADWEIISEISNRLGYKMNYSSAEEIMDELRKVTPSYAGISYSRIEKEGISWPCPTEDHPGTPILHGAKFPRGLGLFAPAEFKPSAELPDAEYPFCLSTGRNYFHYHTGTMTRRSKILHREERFPYVELNIDDAKKLGIRDREWVYVSTRRGEVKALARVGDVVKSGNLFMPFHFEEGAANVLTNNALDPVAKIPEYKVCAAKIRRG